MAYPVGIIPAGTSNALSRALLDTQVQNKSYQKTNSMNFRESQKT